MPPSNYTNLSVHKKWYDKIIRLWGSVYEGNKTFTAWLMDGIESNISREAFIKKAFPHLKFVGFSNDGFVIEDSKTKELVTVYVKNNKLECSDKNVDYIIFATTHPSMKFLP